MLKITLLILATILTLSKTLDHVEYQGLRIDFSALTMNRDIISIITPALNRTLEATFPTITEQGSFWTEFYIHNIRITYYKINEQRFDMNRFTYVKPTYTMHGAFESIFFHLEFMVEKKLFGIPIANSKVTAAVTNTANEIRVHYNESEPDVEIPHPWDIKNMTSLSWLISSKTVIDILHKHFIPHFHKAVDLAMFDFAHELLKKYREIEDVFPGDLDLIFKNNIMSVTPTVEGRFFTIAFNTSMTVNQYLHKKMYRSMLGSVLPQGDFDYCLNSQLVPDVMDILGKGGYYDSEVDPTMMGFASNEVREFFPIFPNLEYKYKPTDQVKIVCSSSRFEATTDLKLHQFSTPVLILQNPLYCFFETVVDGEPFLVADIFIRFFYQMICKDEAFYGHVDGVELFGEKLTPDLPTNRKLILEDKLRIFVQNFHGTDLVSPGIRIVPYRHEQLQFQESYAMSEEICFYYKEKKPL